MDTPKTKRVRSPNFTPDEEKLILRLVMGKKEIVENKKTDGVTKK